MFSLLNRSTIYVTKTWRWWCFAAALPASSFPRFRLSPACHLSVINPSFPRVMLLRETEIRDFTRIYLHRKILCPSLPFVVA
jgi:hypothetical protein